MNQKIHRTLIVSFLFIFTLIPLRAYAIQDAIIAVVNDEVITLQDLKSYIRSAYIDFVAQGLSQADIQKAILDLELNGLNKLIEDKLIISKANQLQMEIRKELIDERLNEIKKTYKSDEDFRQALIKNGGTISELQKIIENQLKIKFVIDHQVKSNIYINPKEITEYYEANLGKFKKPRRVHLDSIFISNKNGKITANEKANEAIAAVKEGMDFKEASEKYSETPSIGVIEEGQLAKNIEDEIFKLQVGEMSPKIEVDNGIYLFNLTGKTPSKVSELREAKDDIQKILFRNKFQREVLIWLDNLKKDAYIEIKQ